MRHTRTEADAYAPLTAIINGATSGWTRCPTCSASNSRNEALVNVSDRQGLEVRYLRCSHCGQEWRQVVPFASRT